MGLVVPAVLPASQKDLEEKLSLFARIPSVSRVQIDVVDGRFASPASWPFSAPGELERRCAEGGMLPSLDRIAYEMDLMCLDAERAAGAWLTLGATRLTFHAESPTDLPRMLASARTQYGDFISFGLALNIASDLALLEPHLDKIDYVQFMGIARIGRQGQPFDKRVFEKIRVFRKRYPDIPVQVDGGVTLESAKSLLALGVSNVVVGSGILKAKDPATAFAQFEALESPFGV
ncbi:MAG: hypothetical protein KGH56_03450 [Patescibacteria group bacterium]|nr:hypothetical protein [Patescibacteria group bacterium]